MKNKYGSGFGVSNHLLFLAPALAAPRTTTVEGDFTRFINSCPSEPPFLVTLCSGSAHFFCLDFLYFGQLFQHSQCHIGPTIKVAVVAAHLEEDVAVADAAEVEAAEAEAAEVEASNVGGTRSGALSVCDKMLLRCSL